MQIEEFFLQLEAFQRKFNIDTSPEGRAFKFFDEVRELDEALYGFLGDPDEEVLDVIITAIALARARGIKNILDACFMKIQRTERKYIAAGLFDNPKAGK